MENDRVAWVLAGGGARGSFQAAVMRKLLEAPHNHHPSVVIGTSVGALNGAGYAFNGIGTLINEWNRIKGRSDVFSLNLNPFSSGIFSSKPLRKMIHRLTENAAHSLPECIVCFTDLNSGKVKYSSSLVGSKDAFRTAVEASAAIPVIVEPVLGKYVDGGVRENCPLRYAIQRGCKKIIVILCSSIDPISLNKKWTWKKEIAIRSFDLIAHEMIMNDVNTCKLRNRRPKNGDKQIDLMVIEPPRRYTCGTLDFSREAIQEGFYYGDAFASFNDARWHRV